LLRQVRRNVVLSFQEDAIGIRLRDVIGVDNVMPNARYLLVHWNQHDEV
jgi:hypothetical protein